MAKEPPGVVSSYTYFGKEAGVEQRNGFWDAVDGRSWSGGPQRDVSPARQPAYEQAFGEADRLVTRLLGEMNRILLGSRGAVSSRRSDWSPAMHVWQLWDDPRQERGTYLYLTLLLTSRNRPYLKVGRQAIPLNDRAEQRLMLALRRAFAQPQVQMPPNQPPSQQSRAL